MFVFGVRKKENKSYDFSLIFEMKRSTLEMQYILLKEENKMKKIGVLFATVIMMMLFAVSASAETEGYYTYEVENGEATITDVDTSISGDVVIPSASREDMLMNAPQVAAGCIVMPKVVE